MPHPDRRSEEILVVDLVRGFSILAVLAFHISLNCGPTPWPWLSNLWVNFALRGMYGVTVFFLISGFLITRTIALQKEGLLNPSLREFYARRAGRIFPLLFAILLLGAFLFWGPLSRPIYFGSFFHNSSLPLDWTFWGSILTFCFNWNMILHEKVAPNGYGLFWGVLWSLSVEEQFYVLYPLLLKRLKTRSSLTALLFLLILTGPLVRFWAYQTDPSRYFLCFMNSFGCFDLMAMGILLYLCQERWGTLLRDREKLSWMLTISGLALAMTAYFNTIPQSTGRILGPSLIGIGVFFFLLGGMNIDLFKTRPFLWLGFPGKLSYGLYLLHVGIIYVLWPWLPHMDTLLAYLLLCSVSFLTAYLSYRFFEVPANRWVRQKFGG